LLALAETAPLVLQDAAIGSCQTAAALQRRIHSRFAAHAPPAEGTKPESGGNLEPRRWGGRNARACKVRWDAIKASCILYKQAVDFVDGANMTSDPAGTEKARCYLACFNAHVDGSGMGGMSKQLTTIARDAFYPIGPSFEYLPCYHAPVKNTNLLVTSVADQDPGMAVTGNPKGCGIELVGAAGEDPRVAERESASGLAGNGRAAHAGAAGDGCKEAEGAGGCDEVDKDGVGPHQATGPAWSSPRVERPGGDKAAKRNKVLKRKAEAKSVEGNEDGGEIMAQLGSLAEAITQDTKLKRRRHEDNLRVQAHKLALDTFNSLYAGVSMSLAERRAALEELQQDFQPKAAATNEATTADVGGKPGLAADDGSTPPPTVSTKTRVHPEDPAGAPVDALCRARQCSAAVYGQNARHRAGRSTSEIASMREPNGAVIVCLLCASLTEACHSDTTHESHRQPPAHLNHSVHPECACATH